MDSSFKKNQQEKNKEADKQCEEIIEEEKE